MTAEQLPPLFALAGAWTDRAACRREDPELFFPVGSSEAFTEQIDKAKSICRTCLVRPDCLDYAIATAQQGIWGGTTDNERRRIRAGELPMPEPDETPGETVTVHPITPARPAASPTGKTIDVAPAPPTPTFLNNLEQLLRRGAASESAATRALAERVGAGVDDLRHRIAAESAEAKVREEIAELEKQLAAKREKLSELRPKKTATKPRPSVPPGIEAKDVRAWAKERGIPCPDHGRIPAHVTEQYMAAIR